MSVLEKVEQSPFVYFGFNPSEETPDNPWAATAIICTSEDGIHWIPVKEFPELGNFRDGNIAKIGDEYWLIGTFAIYRTKDFESFDYFSLNEIIKPNYTEIWAPEFVQDRNTGDWKIVYVANNGIHRIYFADFNPQTGEVTNPYQGTNVIILISHDEFRDAIVESLVKMIQLRYGYNSWILNTIDDLEYIKESDFTPEGLLVLDNDIITYQSMIMNNSNYNQ